MTNSTSSSENKSDTIIKNKAKLVKAIKSTIDTNGFDYLKNKPYDVYLSLVANKSCSKKVAISVLSSLLVEVPSLLLNGRSKSIQKISAVLKENCCLSDEISGELASVYQDVFSDENKKCWEDNKNSGLDYFLEMELDISWEGDSTWECSQGSEDCHFSAEIKVAPLKDSLNTSLIDDLLKENPFITDVEIANVYESDLKDYLDNVFSDYCEGDDYYPPNTEDFEIEYYVGKWCQKNGFKLISAKGDGYEDDFEAWSRRY